MPAVKGGAGVRGDIDRTLRLAADRIDGFQTVSRGDPDVLAVIGDAVHAIDPRKGSVFSCDGRC
jgi:hypothetical protein